MARATPPDRHIEAAGSRLTHLAGLAEKTEATERRILESATDRLKAVDTNLDKLRPRSLLEDEAGDQYQALTSERGQLQMVIARAGQVLGQ